MRKSTLILLLIAIILMLIALSVVAEFSQSIECKSFSVENCPSVCVVCPPCAECSSISCQTEKFCKNIGFDKNWYPNLRKAP